MARRKKRKDAEPFKPAPEMAEWLKKALEEMPVKLQQPPRGPLSPKCCPHCWMHGPFGAAV